MAKPYKIVRDPLYGRHLIAARAIHPGEKIIDEPALVSGPVSNDSPTFTDSPETDVCPVCCVLIPKDAHFLCCKCGLKLCSESCSTSPYHVNQECKIFQNFLWTDSDTDIQGLGTLRRKTLYNFINVIRCMFHRIHSPQVQWAQVQGLESKVKALEKVGTFTELDPFFELLKWDFFTDASSESSINLSQEDVKLAARHCLGVMRTNAFSAFTTTHAREGLYFLSSLMSHSCLMNTDRQMDHERMVTRAAVEIKEGDPITTSYLSYLSGTLERFNETRSTWLFTCRCPRCIDPTECGTDMSTVGCPACYRLTLRPNLIGLRNLEDESGVRACDSDYMVWKCANTACTHSLESGRIPPALEIVQKTRPQIAQNDVFVIEKWLAKYDDGTFLHSNHSLFVQMKCYLCQCYGRGVGGISGLDGGQLLKKVRYCLQILDVFNKLFQGTYIFRGTILFELWVGLHEMERRTCKDQKLKRIFEAVDFSNTNIQRIRSEALSILMYALSHSAEESMAMVLQENNTDY